MLLIFICIVPLTALSRLSDHILLCFRICASLVLLLLQALFLQLRIIRSVQLNLRHHKKGNEASQYRETRHDEEQNPISVLIPRNYGGANVLGLLFRHFRHDALRVRQQRSRVGVVPPKTCYGVGENVVAAKVLEAGFEKFTRQLASHSTYMIVPETASPRVPPRFLMKLEAR